MTSAAVTDAIAAGDLDDLLRLIERLVGAAAWDDLVELRDRARSAYLVTGRQLWPAASNAEYRLALEAPAPYAAAVLVDGAGRFAPGPLPEVVSDRHCWAELAPHVPATPSGTIAGHERVVRGEDLGDDRRLDPSVLDLPARLEPWEPEYLVATYRADRVEVPGPEPLSLAPVALRGSRTRRDDPEVDAALRALVLPWVTASNGVVATAAVRGGAEAAVAALGHGRAGWAELEPVEALRRMAWAGASSGAHGRRRGAATGRFGAWWALAALAGVVEDWPLPPDELGAAAAELRWAAWHPAGEPALGWSLHLAVEDPAEGLAWAVASTDRA